MVSAKPKSEICDKCEVKRNKLRCSICKHATEEWILSELPRILCDLDMFKEKVNKAGE